MTPHTRPPISAALCLLITALIAPLPAATARQEPPAAASPHAPSARRDSGSPQSLDEGSYRIGPGDVLDIRIYNRPQLSRDSVRVDGRGMIRMPLIETEISAACKTEGELARQVAAHYLEYLRSPQVDVFVKEHQAQPVAIIGAVHAPGRFQLQRRMRLIELLSLAGGATEQAGGRIQVTHDPSAVTCEEPAAGGSEGRDETPPDSYPSLQWYELSEVLRGGRDGAVGPYVRPGDVVNLPEADKVFVVGNVLRPSTLPMKGRLTIAQAVSMAGGTLPDTRWEKVRVIRQAPASSSREVLIVNLKAINEQQADDVVLQANDIVDVPTASGKRFLRGLLDAVAPSLSRLPVYIVR